MLLVPMEYSWMILTPFCLHITKNNFQEFWLTWKKNHLTRRITGLLSILSHALLFIQFYKSFLYRILVEDYSTADSIAVSIGSLELR